MVAWKMAGTVKRSLVIEETGQREPDSTTVEERRKFYLLKKTTKSKD